METSSVQEIEFYNQLSESETVGGHGGDHRTDHSPSKDMTTFLIYQIILALKRKDLVKVQYDM